jgi:hypothetical protein
MFLWRRFALAAAYNDAMLPWLLAASLVVSQPDVPRKPIETAQLIVTTSVAETPTPGTRSLILDVTPKPKMHVYSPGQEGYIAIALTLEANPAFTAAKAKYPAGEKLFMPALQETQLVYAKPFTITQAITVKPETGDPIIVKGTLRYQACDDTVCYLPVSVPVTWTVTR